MSWHVRTSTWVLLFLARSLAVTAPELPRDRTLSPTSPAAGGRLPRSRVWAHRAVLWRHRPRTSADAVSAPRGSERQTSLRKLTPGPRCCWPHPPLAPSLFPVCLSLTPLSQDRTHSCSPLPPYASRPLQGRPPHCLQVTQPHRRRGAWGGGPGAGKTTRGCGSRVAADRPSPHRVCRGPALTCSRSRTTGTAVRALGDQDQSALPTRTGGDLAVSHSSCPGPTGQEPGARGSADRPRARAWSTES